MANQSINLPTQQMPVTETGLKVSQPWYRFFQALLNRSAATVPYLVGTALTAAGTTQADATPLTTEWSEVTTTPLNSGVILSDFGAGFSSTVFNLGANALNVYPPVGEAIDALGANNPYSLASGAAINFLQLSATQFRTI